MSETIRSNLLVELKALQTQIREAQQVLAEEPKDDLCVKLNLEKVHLEETVKRIDELDIQWWSYMAKLEETQRMDEEALYMNFPPRDAGLDFIEQCEFARQVLVTISVTIDELESSRESSHQSSRDLHSEESHSVESNNNDRSEDNAGHKPLLWFNPRFRHSQNVRNCRQAGTTCQPLPKGHQTQFWCSLCRGNHPPSRCSVYNNPHARKIRLLEQNRCLNCLRDDHRTFDCRSNRRCSGCRGKHHLMVCYSRIPKAQMLEPNRKNDNQCANPAVAVKAKRRRLSEEKAKILQEKDKKIVKLLSELMLARKKSEDASKKAKRCKRLLSELEQKKFSNDLKTKTKLEKTRTCVKSCVKSLRKINREMLIENARLKGEVRACRKKCLDIERLEPPADLASCRLLITPKVLMIFFAVTSVILDGAKSTMRTFFRETNKLSTCEREKMEKETISEDNRNKKRKQSFILNWHALIVVGVIVAFNPSWLFIALFVNTMDVWAQTSKQIIKGEMINKQLNALSKERMKKKRGKMKKKLRMNSPDADSATCDCRGQRDL
ncbi:hypothetical protein ACQ4LE_004799 [Meloidogyne hapla]